MWLQKDKERNGCKDGAGLTARLSNCILTILSLEQHLQAVSFGSNLLRELHKLRGLLGRTHAVALTEDDVRKVEMATRLFLNEIKPYNQIVKAAFSDADHPLQ